MAKKKDETPKQEGTFVGVGIAITSNRMEMRRTRGKNYEGYFDVSVQIGDNTYCFNESDLKKFKQKK